MIMVIICESFVVICFYTLYIITKMEKLNFVSAIVTGINIKEKRLKSITGLAIQKLTQLLYKNVLCNSVWPDKPIHCFSDSSHSRGVSISIRKGFELEVLDFHRSNDGRKLLTNVRIRNMKITLVKIYALNNKTLSTIFQKNERFYQ